MTTPKPGLDTTGDLFDREQADNPLFAPPARHQARLSIDDITWELLREYAANIRRKRKARGE